jgi:hypothetical protein
MKKAKIFETQRNGGIGGRVRYRISPERMG